jgi:IPT/TIG domain/FG-GAP-like repeat
VFTSFSPSSAGPMDVITIRGKNLQIPGAAWPGQNVGNGLLSVQFGGTNSVWVHSMSDTLLRVSPGTGSSGSITVRTPGGLASLPGFTYVPIPTIQTFSPASGPVGSVVTITGTNFSAVADSNRVLFGSAKARVLTATSTQLTVAVPAGAGFEPIAVTVGTKTAYTLKPFVVSFPGSADFSALSYKERKEMPLSFRTLSPLLADLNGDGRPEMIVCITNAQQILIYPNQSTPGDLQFGSPLQLSTGRLGPYSVKAQDLDADGKPEICFVDGYIPGGLVGIWRNTSNTSLSFVNATPYPGYGISSSNDDDLCVVDINKDGKPDLVSGAAAFTTSSQFNMRFNICTPGTINFDIGNGGSRFFSSGFSGSFKSRVNSIAAADFNNDGLSDLVVGYYPYGSTYGERRISVLRNVNLPQYTDKYYPSFESVNLTMAEGFTNYSYQPYAGDLNGDSLPDIMVANYAFINTGNFSFSASSAYANYANYRFVTDMDGDGKPDLARIVADSFVVVRNRSSNGTINLAPKVAFATGKRYGDFAVADLDGDGKPEVLLTTQNDSMLCILRNKSGEQVKLCPGGAVTLTSNLTGNSYQWQEDRGNGFVNLTGNATANQAILQLPNQHDSTYGYRYRCIVGNQYSYIYSLVFENNWTGAVDNTWENPGNWSCGSAPTRFTDAVIPSGTVVLGSNATVRSLIVRPGVNFSVLPGFTLTITN